jgi:hypothetical protein
MNALFFGSILVAALLTQALYLPLYEWSTGDGFLPMNAGLPMMIVSIFLFNLIVGAFIFVTLSGLVFFIFPVIVLLIRAMLWGTLLNQVPTPMFLIAFPTLILEGEGYVIASIAGVNLGLSWLKPGWVYTGESLSRLKTLKKALKECAYAYFLVTIFLLVAAIVEALTITI